MATVNILPDDDISNSPAWGLSSGSKVHALLDNDDTGQKAMNKISTCMKDSCMLSWIELPKEVKDVQEMRQQTILKQEIENRTYW